MKKSNKKLVIYFSKFIIIDILLAGIIVFAIYLIMYKIPQKQQQTFNVDISNKGNQNQTANLQNTSEAETEIKTNEKYISNQFQKKFKDKFSKTPIVTDTEYKTNDLSVTLEQKSFGQGNDKVTYYIADVYISDIKMLQTHFAQNSYGIGFKEGLKSMSNTMKSVLAINGDSYNNDRHKNSGTIIRNGIVYRGEPTTSDICVLYYDGTMKVYSPQKFDVNQAIQDGAYQTWIFGPNLLDENGKAPSRYNTWDYIRQSHPRSAIGYYEPGHYAFVLVDGRSKGYSRGMTLEELSKVFENLGCKSAYNLDGGHCSFMTMGSRVANKPYKPSKDISDGIFIGEYRN